MANQREQLTAANEALEESRQECAELRETIGRLREQDATASLAGPDGAFKAFAMEMHTSFMAVRDGITTHAQVDNAVAQSGSGLLEFVGDCVTRCSEQVLALHPQEEDNDSE